MRMKKIRLPKLSRRMQMFAVAGVMIAGTSSVAAFNQFSPSSAEETPVEVVVKDHEERITDNELEIADAQNRLGNVEEQTVQNTETIHEVQKQVVVVEKKADTAVQQSTPQSVAVPAPVAPEPVAPPVKVINKKLIVNTVSVKGEYAWECTYTLESGKTMRESHGIACRAVGEELTNGEMNTHKLW